MQDRHPVSGLIVLLYSARYRIFLKFREIAWSRLSKNKIYFFDVCEKIWCNLKTLIFFRLSTKSRTEFKPLTTLVIFYEVFFLFGAVSFVIRKATSMA